MRHDLVTAAIGCDRKGLSAVMGMQDLKYVLITPARNEEQFIEQTILSVVGQTRKPSKWVIVSDASSDRTDEIVKKYLDKYQWIELVRMPEHRDRSFSAKVQCFNSGYERVKDEDFDIIGNLDADITFGRDYFEFLMGKFADDPQLASHRQVVGQDPIFRDGTAGDAEESLLFALHPPSRVRRTPGRQRGRLGPCQGRPHRHCVAVGNQILDRDTQIGEGGPPFLNGFREVGPAWLRDVHVGGDPGQVREVMDIVIGQHLLQDRHVALVPPLLEQATDQRLVLPRRGRRTGV